MQAPEDATLFTDGLKTIVLNGKEEKVVDSVHYIKLEQFSPESILSKLYELQISSVIIEGGAFTLTQFIDAGLWDEALVIVGESEFKSGMKAPVLSKMVKRQVPFGKDLLNYYHNYSL
ncbi:5-amino-6-(5-phosphoribosylamino)uracil reductase [compost metagenome]